MRFPWPTHPGASCDHRERNSALVAIAACFLLALGMVIAAVLLENPADPAGDAARRALGGGSGTGSGNGFGAGTGNGSALAGDGPGAGTHGDRHGATGDGMDAAPNGQVSGTVATANAKQGESLLAGDSRQAPKFGFTLPGANDPLDPPQTATAVGTRTGHDGAGRAGAGGGGGAEFMGIRTVATEIVYLIDFSGSMENVAGRPQMLKQELERSIRALRAGSKFTVVMFGQSPGAGAHVVKRADGGEDSDNYVAMPPAGEWITAGARNTADAVSWVAKRRIDAAANSDIAPAMAMILGMRPQAIFLLTDGAFDTTAFRALQQAIEKGNPGRDVQINTVALTESDAAGGSDVYDLQLLASQNNGTYRRVTVGK